MNKIITINGIIASLDDLKQLFLDCLDNKNTITLYKKTKNFINIITKV